ncbi:serine/threonine protein phosphatase, putative [Leishmania panamensis]|uniref:Serine/threonine-protein phosphatase n=1 Tax=Leishmania panamensis TaxID=5679 RepID=A0A088S424_LEIPA|nr:serine/threonine protein phosphatase, putative [Leishmania panamensis]AIO02350.1 serine/threonine protein phosphatase, putative [Leishmania panamensis]
MPKFSLFGKKEKKTKANEVVRDEGSSVASSTATRADSNNSCKSAKKHRKGITAPHDAASGSTPSGLTASPTGASGPTVEPPQSLSSSSSRKSCSGSATQPLPPPPSTHLTDLCGPRPSVAHLKLQRSRLDDVLISTQRGVDLFPREMSDLTIPQLTEVFQVFQTFLDRCASTVVRQESVLQLHAILPEIAAVDTTMTTESIKAQGFHPTFAIEPMLNHLLEQPAPLRARLCLAIYRFCRELNEELEDDLLSKETGFFGSLQSMNPNLHPTAGSDYGNSEDLCHTSSCSGDFVASQTAKMERCPNIDLPKIYNLLLHKDGYLPSAEELNEIFLRAQELLRAEPNVLMVAMPAVLVGDLHGQIRDLLKNVLALGGPLVSSEALALASPKSSVTKSKTTTSPKSGSGGAAKTFSRAPKSNESHPAQPQNYVFLGDYVDRGPNSLCVIALLFTAKLLSPNTVFMLRGNHECSNTNRLYGFLDECHRLYPIVNNKVTTLRMDATQSPSSGGADGATAHRGGNGSNDPSNTMNVSSSVEPTAAVPNVRAFSAGSSCPDDMGWDMKDHPLWLVANDVLRSLPLCAALCEEVEVDDQAPLPPTTATTESSVKHSIEVDSPENPGTTSSAKELTATKASKSSGSSSANTSFVESFKSKKVEAGKSTAVAGGNARATKDKATNASSESLSSFPKRASTSFTKPKKTRQVVRICAMHGGLSPFIDDSFDGIIAINRFCNIEHGALVDLTWSDPLSSETTRGATTVTFDPNSSQVPLSKFQSTCTFNGTPVGFTGNPRGTGHIFGEDVTINFINTNHLYFIVRAHQCVQEGFQWTHKGRLLTVFSAPNYCGMRNKGAILLLDEKGAPTLKQYECEKIEESPHMTTADAPQPPKLFL